MADAVEREQTISRGPASRSRQCRLLRMRLRIYSVKHSTLTAFPTSDMANTG